MSDEDNSIVSEEPPLFKAPRKRAAKPNLPSEAGDPKARPTVEEPPPPKPRQPIDWWRSAQHLWRGSKGMRRGIAALSPIARLIGLGCILLGVLHLWMPLAALASNQGMLDELAAALRFIPGAQAATLDVGPALAAGQPWWWIFGLAAPFLHFAASRSAAAGRLHDMAFVLAVGLGCAAAAWFLHANAALQPPTLSAETRGLLLRLFALEVGAVLVAWLFTPADPIRPGIDDQTD